MRQPDGGRAAVPQAVSYRELFPPVEPGSLLTGDAPPDIQVRSICGLSQSGSVYAPYNAFGICGLFQSDSVSPAYHASNACGQAHWDEAMATRRVAERYRGRAKAWQEQHSTGGSTGKRAAASPSTEEQELGAAEAMAATG